MPNEKTIKIEISATEAKFIQFYRELKYGDAKITIVDSEPVHAVEIHKSHIFQDRKKKKS